MSFDQLDPTEDGNNDFEAVSKEAGRRLMNDDVLEGPPQYGPDQKSEVLADMGGLTGLQLENQGDIAAMDVPDKWVAEPEKGAYERRGTSIGFNPPDARDARLVVNLSDANANPSVEAAFKQITSEPHHELTAEEKIQLRQMFGPLGDPKVFDLKARTTELNGRNVVAFEGKFKDGDRQVQGYMLTTSNNEMQQIFFSAPQKAFQEHKLAADSAITSVEWRQASKPVSQRATPDML